MSGCNGQQEAMVRDPVHKVTGTLTIDGKPEQMVAVRMVRVGEPDAKAVTSQMLTPSGFTDAQGRFVIGTYENGPNGDGAADGKYALTFQWGQINLLGGRYEGDKFNGKYADPETSEFIVRVEGGPVEVPAIELNTKDIPEVKGLPSLNEAGKAPAAAPAAAPQGATTPQ